MAKKTPLLILSLIVPLVVLTPLLQVLVATSPVQAAPRSNNDKVHLYNRLVGFKHECGLSGGGDGVTNRDGVNRVWDDVRGSDNDAGSAGWFSGDQDEPSRVDGSDPGQSLVVGMQLVSSSGMASCQGVIQALAPYLASFYDLSDVEGEISGAQESRDFIIMLMKLRSEGNSLSQTKTRINQLYRSGNERDREPFPLGQGTLGLRSYTWEDFAGEWLDPAIQDLRPKITPVNRPEFATRVLPALNTCFEWSTENSVRGLRPIIRIGDLNGFDLFDSTDISARDLQRAVPGYKDKSGLFNSDDDEIASVSLGFAASDTSHPFSEDHWFPLGYDAKAYAAEMSDPILSCDDLSSSSVKPLYANQIELGENGNVKLTDEANAAAVAGGLTVNDGNGDVDPNKCEGGGGVIDGFLGFIVCPLVEGILGVIQWAETNIIIPYLIIDPLDSDDDNNAVYIMWQALRNIAFVLLVVAFMYLVFAETTALGGEAYQLKRLAPRLVMVTIAISLSYFAIGLVIDFFNVLGLGIAQITAWAMKETGQPALVTIDGGVASAGLMAFIAGTGALALVSALLSGSLAAPLIGIAALTGIFIVLAVVITLVLRQVVVMSMIILAPLAFVALLLPNTEKLFKTWWSILTKALVMYPLIMLLFAAGKIFGALITSDAFASSGTMDVAVKSLLGFVANIAPMALIPFTFKLAGGVIGGAWGAMRGGISKGRKQALGSEHNPRSLLNKSREKSYRKSSERMAGQRSWLPRVPFMRRIRGTTLNQHATRALANAPYIGGWMAGNERIAGARADAQKRIDEIGNTEIGEKRLEEIHMGSKARNPVDPNATDRKHKGIPGFRGEAARKRKDHQYNLMVASHFGHKGSYVGSDERNRFFAQDLKERADGGEITHEQADELWEEYGRAGEHINPLIHASILGTSARESREAFATDQSLDGATRTGVVATTVGGVTTHAKTDITGTPQAAIAENLLSNEHVVQEMVTGLTARVGNADQVSPHTLTAMNTVFSDPSSSVVKHIMESQTNRDNIKQVVADLRGRTQAAGYNVSAEQQIINQQTADTLERAHDAYTGMSLPPGAAGPTAPTPTTPATKI